MKKSAKIWLIVVSIVVVVVLAVTLTIVLVNKNKEFASAEVDGIKFEMTEHGECNKLTLDNGTYRYSIASTIRLMITNDTSNDFKFFDQFYLGVDNSDYPNLFLKSIKNIDTGEVLTVESASSEYFVVPSGTQGIYDIEFEVLVFSETDNGAPESLLKQKINDNYTTLANLNRKGTKFTVGLQSNTKRHTIVKQKLRIRCFNYDDLISTIDSGESA